MIHFCVIAHTFPEKFLPYSTTNVLKDESLNPKNSSTNIPFLP